MGHRNFNLYSVKVKLSVMSFVKIRAGIMI